MQSVRATTFLPLTTNAAARLARGSGTDPARRQALVVRHRAEEADAAAAQCWTALLAGCDTAGRAALGPSLRRLSEATSYYVGTRWWFTDGSTHRRRVAQAQQHIEDAIVDGDGQEFASAFVGYDNAMASAVVCAARTNHDSRSRTP
ncbi:hypothetical protein FB471_2340 [Amycolatopsis cihanbeyliensis]|uniref:Uncharacterized protein n=1 Tax=Amycolatopsis cihanbeyliensis TaxID=1128664 RepID=A0A542DHP0_AMYCI|nr:hypothetical protein FB471_2340 [Amycolatopsis cihanbeyliensis]